MGCIWFLFTYLPQFMLVFWSETTEKYLYCQPGKKGLDFCVWLSALELEKKAARADYEAASALRVSIFYPRREGSVANSPFLNESDRLVGWGGWFSKTRVCVRPGCSRRLWGQIEERCARLDSAPLSRINKLRLAEKMWAISEKLPTATAVELNSRANEVFGEK